MQPLNAIAVRQPANTPAAAGPAAAAPAPNEPVTPESLGWQLRAALPPLRLHSVSLYDEEANVLWLSEGALGPDEHNVVVEAIDALRGDATQPCYEAGMEDGRIAVFLPVRAPQGSLVGLAMILADNKSVGDGVIERMLTPQIRTILQRVAVLLRPAAQQRASQTQSLKILELAPDAVEPAPVAQPPAKPVAPVPTLSLAPSPPAKAPAAAPRGPSPAKNAPALQPAAAQPPVLSPEAVDDILEFELSPDIPAVSQQPKLAEAPAPVAAVAPIVAAAPVVPVAVPVVSAAVAAPVVTPAPAFAAVPATPAGAAATSATEMPAAATAVPVPEAAPANPSLTGTSKTIASATGTSKSISATSTSKSLSATSTSKVLTLPEGMTLSLDVQPFTKLRTGGRTRRYEVTPRSSHPNRIPSGFDKIALQQLLAWMGSNRGVWNLEPTSFTLNLSIATLEDERFPQFVASNLKTHGIAADNIGFEIAEPLCLQRRAQVERFITLCDKLGCFVVIDDFSLDSSIVSLLRSKALRLVKIDPKLTSIALKDKLAQAMVVAIAQAVKVLGIHCAAKRVESQASLQWLTAIGCDFAQGSALAQPHAIETLGTQPPPPQTA